MKKVFSLLLTVLMLLFPFGIALSHEIQPESIKMSPELLERIGELGQDDSVEVYVVLFDIDHDRIMESFECSFPDEYCEYIKAKNMDTGYARRVLAEENPDYDESEYTDPINNTLLQNAIEQKRSLYVEEYTRLNNGFLAKHSITDPLFVSKYAPLLILSVTKEELYILEKDDMVFSLDLFVNLKAESELVIANKMSKAEVVRDSYGNKGAGVKIGQIEDGVPSITGSELANASITCYSTCCGNTFHATCVAKILVGQTNGVAPQADLYCTDYCDSLSFYPGVEWLLSQGVNIINMSAQLLDPQGNDHLSPEGKYETGCKWVDHIAIEHDVHFVKSAGNRGLTPEGSDGDCLITCPGMAYNVITVGGFDDWNDENAVNDCMSSSTSYEESLGSHRAEKPNMVAAESIEGFGAGTSFAAPQVAGVIAQLCSYESSLKTKQSIMGAILAAGSTIKVTGINHGSKNGRFNTSDTFTINPQISDKEGAGKLNAKDARTVVKNGKYWKKTINADSFPYTQNVYISSANNTLIRVAVFWLKRNSLSSSDHTNTSMTEPPFSNLDLKVYAPDGSLIDTSETDWSNFEIVQFKPTQTGYYQIVISKTGTNSSTKEYVGIAVW